MHAASHRQTAVTLYTRLGSAVLPPHRSGRRKITHIPRAFNTQWIVSLPIPAEDKDPGQTVALMDEDSFFRHVDEHAIIRAYAERPRTRVFENIHARSDDWASLLTLYLAGLLRRRVTATMYESRAGDLTLGPHHDPWDGVIVQMRGAKTWRLWPPTGDPYQVQTRAGDVLLLPRGVKHEVTTPDYSVHLVLAVTDKPLTATTGTSPPSTA